MIKYRAIRNCLVMDRKYERGQVYELPDKMPKYPSNFEVAETVAPKPVGTTTPKLVKCKYPRCRYKGTQRGLVLHRRKHAEG